MKILDTADGSHTIFSEQFGVSYHSKYGAIQETQHVFINAGLRLKAIVKKDISILGIGFGTGLNALMTCLEATKHNLNINYVGVEAFPVPVEMARQLNFGEYLKDENVAALHLKIHESEWEKPIAINQHFTLTKVEKRFQDLDYQNQFDIIYFDAFAPSSQPELWEEAVMQIMYNALLPEGVLATYCAKGSFKRTLKAVGFQVEKLQGPPGKREMTRALKK